jgi:hypothetical protein
MNRFMREGSIQQNQLLLGLDNLWNESVLLLKVIKHSCWEVFFFTYCRFVLLGIFYKKIFFKFFSICLFPDSIFQKTFFYVCFLKNILILRTPIFYVSFTLILLP